MPTDLISPNKSVDLAAGPIRYVDLGSGEPLLFVHGFLVDHNLWRKVIPDLSAHFRCIAPTWPLGSHRAAMKADADLSPPGIARLIVEFLDALGLEHVTLIGNDTGGAICQLVATTYPDRVKRLVLTPCDAFDNFPPGLFRFLKITGRSSAATWLLTQSLRPQWARRLPLSFGWISKYRIDDEALESYVRPAIVDAGVRRDSRKVIAGIDSALTLEAAEELASFDKPTLIAWAREDRLFPAEHGKRLAQIIPNARLEWIEDSATFVPEDQPEALTKLLIDFARA
jgi:pimeloyl-ACP methyl ester carboxylesterase